MSTDLPKAIIRKFIGHLQFAYESLENVHESELFLVGDFNINMLDEKHPNTVALHNYITGTGCKQLIDEPTRYDPTHGNTLLDLIITNSQHIKYYGTTSLNISDHLQVFTIREHIKLAKVPITFTGRLYRNFYLNTVTDNIAHSDWTNFEHTTDPQLQ